MRDYIEARIERIPEGGCWIWMGYVDSLGYARFQIPKTQIMTSAHRASYEAFVGSIPKGLCVLHKCDNPSCVNPTHLFIGTQLDNMRDKCSKGRHSSQKKTHCKNGHEFTPENTFIAIDGVNKGRRRCRICRAENLRVWRKQKKEN